MGKRLLAIREEPLKGHKIDVFIPSYDRAMEWGVKKVKLKVLTSKERKPVAFVSKSGQV